MIILMRRGTLNNGNNVDDAIEMLMLRKSVMTVLMLGTIKMIMLLMMYGSYSDNSGYTFETNYGNDNDANDENDGIEASGVGD